MNSKLKQKFKAFVQGIEANDRIAVMHHSDADGLMGAIIIDKALQKLVGKRAVLCIHQAHSEVNVKPETIKAIKKAKANKVISVDLCIDEKLKDFKPLEKAVECVLVLDHHKLYNDLNSKKTVHIKSHMISKIDPSDYPASKLAFDLFSEIINLDSCDWLAVVGLIGDYSAQHYPVFVKKVLKKYKLKGKEAGLLKELQKLVDVVECVSLNDEKHLFEEFFCARNPRDLLKSKYWKFHSMFDSELNYWINAFPKKAEFFPEKKFVFYFLKPKCAIKSPLINSLSKALPDQTLVLVMDLGEKSLTISARNQSRKVKCNELLEKSVKGLKDASAGGHIPAAGGIIRRKYLKKFRQNLLKYLEKQFK